MLKKSRHSLAIGLAFITWSASSVAQVPVSRSLHVQTSSASTSSTATKAATPQASSPPVQAKQLRQLSLELQVGVVIDKAFPDLDNQLISRALENAAKSFQDRFGVTAPRFVVSSTMSVDRFLAKAPVESSERCRKNLQHRYRGTGLSEFSSRRDKAIQFLKRWPLKSLTVFVDAKNPEAKKNYGNLYEYLAKKYVNTVEQLKSARTSTGTPLVEPNKTARRSFAMWFCALSEQTDYDVIITNTFIMADIMTEPHPHAFMGRAKIGGIAGPNQHRKALGRSALLATTFGIDTHIDWLSELSGTPATEAERASILGDYLLAHEIAHAVFGIPDMFDHPSECLMTSRPDETYRQGLKLLQENIGACPRCRKWVKARAYLDKARAELVRDRPKTALRYLARASSRTPKHFHGGYKKRMSQISYLVSQAYQKLKRKKRAKRFAKRALQLDPKSTDAIKLWKVLTSTTGSP